jgi:hypothetical protein
VCSKCNISSTPIKPSVELLSPPLATIRQSNKFNILVGPEGNYCTQILIGQKAMSINWRLAEAIGELLVATLAAIYLKRQLVNV